MMTDKTDHTPDFTAAFGVLINEIEARRPPRCASVGPYGFHCQLAQDHRSGMHERYDAQERKFYEWR